MGIFDLYRFFLSVRYDAPMAEADPNASELQSVDVHKTRSRFLDAFARIENQLGRLAEEAGIDPNYRLPVGNRIDAIRKSVGASTTTKELIIRLNELHELVELRGNIVHAQTSELRDPHENAQFFVFLNPPFQKHKAVVVSAEQMEKYRKRAFELANELKQFSGIQAKPKAPTPAAPAAPSAKA